MATWNLGGQPVEKIATADACSDIFLIQEVARDEVGWREIESDTHFWLTHRDDEQWRGVGIGISNEIFDSVIAKRKTKRGILALVKLKGRGRVVLGTLHAHTGVTNKIYQEAVAAFMHELGGKWRHYPCIVGIDANESIRWDGSTSRPNIAVGTSNLNLLTDRAVRVGLTPIAPRLEHRLLPTHYPRDTTREGRHIDGLWTRRVSVGEVKIDAEARHRLGSDHAILTVMAFFHRTSTRWWADSRPRFVSGDLPCTPLVDADDVAKLARDHTRPMPGKKYVDPDEVVQAIRDAKAQPSVSKWKKVHQMRKLARHKWENDRISSILKGDWGQYRERKRQLSKKSGWWGRMLEYSTEEEITEGVRDHLESKLAGQHGATWSNEITQMIASVETTEWVDFTLDEIRRELSTMKRRSSVGT